MMSEGFEELLESFNLVFMVIFSVEAIIRITAMKKAYFYDRWNLFDFIIIVLSVLFMIPVTLGYFEQYQGVTTVIRVLRVARMMRLMVKARKLQIIFQTLQEALATISSLGFLLILSIYLFSLVGV